MNRNSLEQIWAITKKELRLETRFWLPFISSIFLNPVKTAAWFFIVYFGFFTAGSVGLGSFTRETYILFILIGGLFQIFFTLATTDFANKFLCEKYWQTIQSIIIMPIHIFKLVLGLSLEEIIKASLAMMVFIGLGLLVWPTNPWTVMIIISIILIIFLGLMFLGLLRAAFVLINENVNTIFEYGFLFLGFISCFYYPIEAFPSFLRPLIFYNPIYQGINLVRNLWLGQSFDWTVFAYLSIWTILTAIFSTFLYNRLLKKYDLQGY